MLAHYNGGLTTATLMARALKAFQKGPLEGMGDYLIKQGIQLPLSAEANKKA